MHFGMHELHSPILVVHFGLHEHTCFSTHFAYFIGMLSGLEYMYIKTHYRESRGQEEAGRTRRTSELFIRSTALKLVNALNKPP